MRKLVFVLLAGATLVGTSVINAGATGAAKPGAGAVKPRAGTLVTHTSLKAGTVRAARTRVAGGKSAHFGASPFLRGYVVVAHTGLSNPNGSQAFGDVACPTGKVAFGGGVFGDSTSLAQNVNSSFPEVSGGVA